MQETNFINKLEEKIYMLKDYNDNEQIIEQLQEFFQELIERKRNDPIEGGLQATLIICKDKMAAKVNEKDGMETHLVNEINLIRYLNNNYHFITEKAIGKFLLYMHDIEIISSQAIVFRILDGESKLMLAITSNKEIETEFEKIILKNILNICKNIKEQKIYEKLEIGIHFPKSTTEFVDLNEFDWTIFDNLLSNKSLK